jgi:ABC-type sugar transport system ATPase subunit
MASVRFQQVTKSYPGAAAPAIGCVDLEIREGELFVLLGPSGCGKSTLLKLVAGIEEPDDGAVWVGGRVVNYVPPAQRDVAMVFQNYALYPHMTVEQNVRFPLRMRRAPRREADEAVARALALLDLQEYAGRSVSQLSGGQRQRVAVARALVRRPAVLLPRSTARPRTGSWPASSARHR